MSILAHAAIASGTLATSEAAAATTAAAVTGPGARVVIRGSVLLTGNASAGTVTLKLRQGASTTTGTQVWTSGALTLAASEDVAFPFGAEDDTGWLSQEGGGQYTLTAVASAGTGTINGGDIAVEVIP